MREFFLERVVDPVTWFTFGLLVLGILQYLAMRRQADYMQQGLADTKMAAKAALRSAKVGQKQLLAAHEQWLDFVDWHANYVEFKGDRPAAIDVGFRLLNNTAHKIIVTGIAVNTNADSTIDEVLNLTLPPRRGYPMSAPEWTIDTTERRTNYQNGVASFRVHGVIDFTNVIGEKQKQPFSYVVAGGRIPLSVPNEPPAFRFIEADWLTSPEPQSPADQKG